MHLPQKTIRELLQKHLQCDGTMNDHWTEFLYRQWFNIGLESEIELEKIELWAVKTLSS